MVNLRRSQEDLNKDLLKQTRELRKRFKSIGYLKVASHLKSYEDALKYFSKKTRGYYSQGFQEVFDDQMKKGN